MNAAVNLLVPNGLVVTFTGSLRVVLVSVGPDISGLGFKGSEFVVAVASAPLRALVCLGEARDRP